ncbi:hypothetical protein GLOTRDRAFT_130748 [Gloeophyllum trabeum ATCC 11539]|uniref:Protein kinase domain-containing protein n=1 Tax=Gloeophyllum trabeum (strain ATCC 11539 / FP-39264 / Madison 617) TaxID=670483 RepID=S7RL64_GLOTA|nr:uncharacterized protein GLOTRDRAFT_130748 [Gloeophyllum trabeum ATCC 11539]EPQ53409.1 hypothetical protein GLOTRDRAFT_130748 [Gloeophyllum trabeum ATCC 11539]
MAGLSSSSKKSTSPAQRSTRRQERQARSGDKTSGHIHPYPTVGRVFLGEVDVDYVHVLVADSEILESLDEVGELDSRTWKTVKVCVQASVRLMVLQFAKVVNQNKDVFHTGRPASNYGPPVALFNSVLGWLAYQLSRLEDISEIHPASFRAAHEVVTLSLGSYPSQDIRVDSLSRPLQMCLGMPFTWKLKMAGIEPNVVVGGSEPFGLMEVKNEVGLNGDASLQAGLVYARIVTETTGKMLLRRKQSNCPTILISIMGDLLEIAIATHTDGPYIDCLFSERLRLGFHELAVVSRVACVFKAVKEALTGLERFCSEIDNAPPPLGISFLFPSPSPCPSYEHLMPRLKFAGRLSVLGKSYQMAEASHERRSGLYLATLLNSDVTEPADVSSVPDIHGREVAVKFTTTYNSAAHKLMAEAGLAPALHACVPVLGGLTMVPLPYSIYKDVKTAVELLHAHNIVFGDLRTPNIMCIPGERGSDEAARAMLIDFDWIGIHTAGRYPPTLNDSMPIWPSSVQRGAPMLKAHDLEMHDVLKKVCLPEAS